MLLFGHKLTAAEANESGLVSKVYTEEEINNILWPQLKKNAAEFPTKVWHNFFYFKDFNKFSLKAPQSLLFNFTSNIFTLI